MRNFFYIFFYFLFIFSIDAKEIQQIKIVHLNKIKSTDWRGNQEVGWFISDFVLTIGMIGTVSGFLLMLTGAFAGIDLTDEVAMKNVLEKMSKGMSTALYTTLFGLICGSLLKIQYFNLGRATDLLIGPIDKKI